MKLEKGLTYWISNPQHGTQRARLEIVSANQGSLFLTLEMPVFLRSRDGGGAITRGLPLLLVTDDDYVDLIERAA